MIGKQSTLNDLQKLGGAIFPVVEQSGSFFKTENGFFNASALEDGPEADFLNGFRSVHHGGGNVEIIAAFSVGHYSGNKAYASYQAKFPDGSKVTKHAELLTDKNTIVDVNGFIKTA